MSCFGTRIHLQADLLLTHNADDLLLTEPASLHPSIFSFGCGHYFSLETSSGLRPPGTTLKLTGIKVSRSGAD